MLGFYFLYMLLLVISPAAYAMTADKYSNQNKSYNVAFQNTQSMSIHTIELYPTVVQLLQILRDASKADEHPQALAQIKLIYKQQISLWHSLIHTTRKVSPYNKMASPHIIKVVAYLRLAQMFVSIGSYDDYAQGITLILKEFVHEKIIFNVPAP